MKNKSQCDIILDYLKAGNHITSLDAVLKFRCLRLSARIKDLRDKGHRIGSALVEGKDGKKYAEYWLVQIS